MLRQHLPAALVALVVGLLLAAHAGGALRLVYPAMALLVAVWLEATNTASFVGFVLWLWMMSPLVQAPRRLPGRLAGSQSRFC